MQDKCSEH